MSLWNSVVSSPSQIPFTHRLQPSRPRDWKIEAPMNRLSLALANSCIAFRKQLGTSCNRYIHTHIYIYIYTSIYIYIIYQVSMNGSLGRKTCAFQVLHKKQAFFSHGQRNPLEQPEHRSWGCHGSGPGLRTHLMQAKSLQNLCSMHVYYIIYSYILIYII